MEAHGHSTRRSDRVIAQRAGSMAETPFSEIVAWLALEKVTGTLILRRTARLPELRILVQRGRLIAFDPAPVDTVGHLRTLFDEVRDYSFYSGADFTFCESRAAVDLAAIELLRLCLRSPVRPDLVRSHWASLQHCRVRIRPNRALLDRLQLAVDQERFLEILEASTRLRKSPAVGALGTRRSARLLYVLSLLGMVEVEPRTDESAPIHSSRRLRKMRDFNGALEVLCGALVVDPANPMLLVALAEAYLDRAAPGDAALALEAVEQVLDATPTHAHAHYVKALVLRELHQKGGLFAALKRALRLK